MKVTAQLLTDLGFAKKGKYFVKDGYDKIGEHSPGVFSINLYGEFLVSEIKDIVAIYNVTNPDMFKTPLREVLNSINCDYEVNVYGGSGFENAEDAMFDVTDRFGVIHKFIGVEEAEAFYNNLKGEKCCWQMSELIMCHTKKA